MKEKHGKSIGKGVLAAFWRELRRFLAVGVGKTDFCLSWSTE